MSNDAKVAIGIMIATAVFWFAFVVWINGGRHDE